MEYADTGQTEEALQEKIAEFLDAGTRIVWVVRLQEPLKVEIYEPGCDPRIVDEQAELTAPGILENPVPVRALVDRAAADQANLRNLLNQQGYRDLPDVKAEGFRDGKAEGMLVAKCELLLMLLAKRGLPLEDRQRQRIQACAEPATLDRWLDHILDVRSIDELLV